MFFVAVKGQLDMAIQWSSTVLRASAGATNLHMMAKSSYDVLVVWHFIANINAENVGFFS